MRKFFSLICIIAMIVSSTTVSFAMNPEAMLEKNDPNQSYLDKNTIVSEYHSLPKSFREYIGSESEDGLMRSGSTGWKDYELIDSGWYQMDKDLGWHKEFSREMRVDEYWFSKDRSVSMSVSVGYQVLYFGVSAASSPSAGFVIYADSSIWTRPKVYGDIKFYDYNVKEYNGAGILIAEYEETILNVDRTRIVAVPYGN